MTTTKPVSVEKVLWRTPGKGIAAEGKVPREAEFFKDHFPGFPVLPGVLALEMLRQSAELYLKQTAPAGEDARYVIRSLRGVKFTHYLRPGDAWQSHLEVAAERPGETEFNARLLHDGKTAVTARVVIGKSSIPKKMVLL